MTHNYNYQEVLTVCLDAVKMYLLKHISKKKQKQIHCSNAEHISCTIKLIKQTTVHATVFGITRLHCNFLI